MALRDIEFWEHESVMNLVTVTTRVELKCSKFLSPVITYNQN